MTPVDRRKRGKLNERERGYNLQSFQLGKGGKKKAAALVAWEKRKTEGEKKKGGGNCS